MYLYDLSHPGDDSDKQCMSGMITSSLRPMNDILAIAVAVYPVQGHVSTQ